jgi:uncharacterized membrane protein YgcG
MNYNPYAAPQAAPPQVAGAQLAGAPQPWEIGEVLARSWDIYKANWGVLSGAFAVMILCTAVPVYVVSFGLVLSGNGPGTDAYTPVYGSTNLINQLISAFFMIGMYRISLAAARGQAPQFATLFSGGSRFLPFFGMTLLMYIAIGFGLLFLVVPGVILGCGLWAGGFYIADSDLGVMDSLRASWEAMKGQKGAYFLFALVIGLLQIAGVLACCVGVFVTVPLYFIAQAIVFLRISGRGGEIAAPMAPAYGGPPGGYGGPPPGGAPPGYGGPPPGGGYGGPPGGAPPAGGGYGGPPPGAPPGGYGPPGGGGGGYGPGGGGGYGPGGGGGGGYGPGGGGGFPPR